MPLHEWTDRRGWEGVHHLWITELLRWIKPRLPAGFRAYIGSAPLLAVGAPDQRPDVGVRSWPPADEPGAEGDLASGVSSEPDEEVAVAAIDPGTSIYVESQGRLIAAVEVISPRNKDRPSARIAYLSRYVGYLIVGANLVILDVHRRPSCFSFADRIADELELRQPSVPAPLAVSYRVGEAAASGGRLLAVWRRPMTVGEPLPTIPLPLTTEVSVPLDLEGTYNRAAADAYQS